MVLALFVYPLGYSLVTAFEAKGGGFTTSNFVKAFEFYSVDIGFTLVIIGLSTILIGLASIAIGGYLVLGENPRAVIQRVSEASVSVRRSASESPLGVETVMVRVSAASGSTFRSWSVTWTNTTSPLA